MLALSSIKHWMAITGAEGRGTDKLALSSLLGKTTPCSAEIQKWVDIVDYVRNRCSPIINRWTNSGACSVKASVSKQNTLRYLPNAGSPPYIKNSLISPTSTIVRKISQLYIMVGIYMKRRR